MSLGEGLRALISPEIWASLLDGSCTAYVVGGAVRDVLSGQDCRDVDFVLFGPDAEQCVRSLADRLGGSFVLLDAAEGHYRLLLSGVQYDFAKARGADITADLRYRDFTINAIAYDIQTGSVLDPTGGMTDLRQSRLRTCDPMNLQSDRLRCMRAFRLCAQLRLHMSVQTLYAIIDAISTGGLTGVSVERINHELWTMLETTDSYGQLRAMWQIGLLQLVLPGLASLATISSNAHHHLPLWEHTLELIRVFEQNYQADLALSAPQLHTLKMACILHDIAKPATAAYNGGRQTFYNHDKLGAEMSIELGETLKWSNRYTQQISTLVRYHLMPFQMMQPDGTISEKAMYRLFRRVGDAFPLLSHLCRVDLWSVRGRLITHSMINQSDRYLAYLLEQYLLYKARVDSEEPLLRGDLLRQTIDRCGIAPTKKIQQLLDKLYEIQLQGRIKTADEAVQWFLRHAC